MPRVIDSRMTKRQIRELILGLSSERKARLLEDLKLNRLASDIFRHGYSKELYAYTMELLGLTQ